MSFPWVVPCVRRRRALRRHLGCAQSAGFVGSTRGVVGGVVAAVVLTEVAVVKLWSSSTVGANVGPVDLGMHARGGVGGIDNVYFVV